MSYEEEEEEEANLAVIATAETTGIANRDIQLCRFYNNGYCFNMTTSTRTVYYIIHEKCVKLSASSVRV